MLNILSILKGITCNTVQGAMYAFPCIILPEKAMTPVNEAADVFYAPNVEDCHKKELRTAVLWLRSRIHSSGHTWGRSVKYEEYCQKKELF